MRNITRRNLAKAVHTITFITDITSAGSPLPPSKNSAYFEMANFLEFTDMVFS